MKHIFSITRNSILVASLLFSSVYSHSIQEWVFNNPCKAFIMGAVGAYGVYYGATHCAKKTSKRKRCSVKRTVKTARRPSAVTIDKVDVITSGNDATYNADNNVTQEKDIFFDENAALVTDDNDIFFESIAAQEDDNFFVVLSDENDNFIVSIDAADDEQENDIFVDEYTDAIVDRDDEYVNMIIDQDMMVHDNNDDQRSKDIVWAREVTDYQDFLRGHQDELGNTFLQDFAAQSILLTEEEALEKAPEMLLKFYQKIYNDEHLTQDDVSAIVSKIIYGDSESDNELYAQFLLSRNYDGKTAKEIAAEGTTEWSKQLFKGLQEEENDLVAYLQEEGMI